MDAWRQAGLIIRTARLEDLDVLVKLECASFPDDRVSRASLRRFLKARDRPVIAAVVDGALAGYALLSLRKGSRVARIYSIAVDADFARRGIGIALMQASERFALAHRRAILRLEVRYDNAPAIALYEKLGFRQFGEHVDYYADGATALRYEKILVPAARAKSGQRRRAEPRI